jgi:hypothetical protein
MREDDMGLVGYARVSSLGQSLDVQLEKLMHCDKIFQEKKMARRPHGLAWTPAWTMSGKAISSW